MAITKPTSSQIRFTPSGGITSTDLQSALVELDTDKVSSAFTPSGGISATTIEGAITELDTEKASNTTLAASGGAALVGFNPTGAIAATNTQAAIAELDTEKTSATALAASGGAALVGFLQAGTGAVATTAQDEMRAFVRVKQFGANTAAVQSAIDSLAGAAGFVFIDRGVSYTYSSLVVPENVTLFDQANNRIVFHDVALEDGAATNLLIRNPANGATRVHMEPRGNVVGTAAKLDLMFDPYQSDAANYRLLNFYTKTYSSSDASTTAGNNGIAVIGAKGEGKNFGIWPAIHVGFSDDGAGSAVPMKLYYFDTSDTTWRTPMRGMWLTGFAVNTSDYMLSANKLYQAVAGGTTGSTAPSHTSGSASDGSVSWAFIRDFAAASGSIKGCVMFGDRDDLPKFGLSTVRVQYSQDFAVWNSKKIRFLSGTNTSAWSIYTSGGSDDLYIETEDGAKRLRLDATGQFLQITGLSVASSGDNAVNLDTTPTIKGVRTLVFGNTSATSVTQFDNGIAYQEFFVRSGNSNTTLVHGTNLRLIGGVNKTLGIDDCLLFHTGGSGAVATQVA